MNYQCIEQEKQRFPVVVMCQVLGISQSGISAWRKRPTCRRQCEDAHLSTQMRQVFTAHHGRYGSPRLHAGLRDQGKSISRKRVARLMREARNEEMVAKAFQMALVRRRPKAGLLHQSDRGCHYTSHAYRQRREQAGMGMSMSRTGKGSR
jgi:transposase InsO family protein